MLKNYKESVENDKPSFSKNHFLQTSLLIYSDLMAFTTFIVVTT